MSRDEFQAAVGAFLGQISGSFWEEHGISEEEAEDGLLAAFASLGLDVEGLKTKIVAERKAEQRRSRRAWLKREKERRAKMTPEERELEDKIQHSLDVSRMTLIDRLTDDILKPSARWTFLRGPVSVETTPSPNTASYTDGDERSPP